MLQCFKAKIVNKSSTSNDQLGRLTAEVANLREDIKILHHMTSNALPKDTSVGQSDSIPDETNKTRAAPTSGTDAMKEKRGDMTNPDDCDVMISLNCRTMLAKAQRFRSFLEAHGLKVWLCVNMIGGVDFRDEIIAAVDACEVFLPLINEAWCESKECKYEFNYGFRKNLTSEAQIPAILPICFPDLQWNKHAHVRALLANTNAIVYNEEGEEECLSRLVEALKANGLKLKSTRPSLWTSDETKHYVQQMIFQSIEQEGHNVDGSNILSMDTQTFENIIAKSARNMKVRLGRLEEEAVAEEDGLSLTTSANTGNKTSASTGKKKKKKKKKNESQTESYEREEKSYDGMYKVIAKTTNYYDQNVTESNVFLVTLQRNGVSSSGCVWNAGSIHNNYDGVTSVWQGEYRGLDGSFFFTSLYSNDTNEIYAGNFERCGGDDGFLYSRGASSKYAWFGYGRESYGMLDMLMCKLSSDEEREVKTAMQSLTLNDPDAVPLEAIMKEIGPQMSWDHFHKAADSHPAIMIDNRGFCSTPPYDSTVCLSAPIAIQFDLPQGFTPADNCIVSIISEGSEEPDENFCFQANEYTVARGYVFTKENVPRDVGNYEIALFSNAGAKIGIQPIEILTGNAWRHHT